MTSADGVAWTRHPTQNQAKLWGLVYDSGRFVGVGDGGAILTCDVAPRMGPISRSPLGVAAGSVSGVSGLLYTVQASTNLMDWVMVTNVFAPNGTAALIDPAAMGHGHRFYRAVSPIPPPSSVVLIPAGTFTMGDALDGDIKSLPLHQVFVSSFYMDATLVTFELWKEVYQWATSHGYRFEHEGSGKAEGHPVQTVSWYDVVKWCNARSEMEGRVPAYFTNGALTAVYRSGQIDLLNAWVKWDQGYRLPTEAEWEKAARGGLIGQRFPWGDTISWDQANYGDHPIFDDTVYPYTSPVGYFPANGYGLFDMAGNVWEWCWDWKADYVSGLQSDPRGPPSGNGRRIRGGSYITGAGACSSAFRYAAFPKGVDDAIGFRCVLPVSQ